MLKNETVHGGASIDSVVEQMREDVNKAIADAIANLQQHSLESLEGATLWSVSGIAQEYLEHQRQIIESLESLWTPRLDLLTSEEAQLLSTHRAMAEAYSKVVRSVVDNMLSV